MVNNGHMRIESNYFVSPNAVPLPTKETTSGSMYETGWNLLCYTNDNTNYNFLSFPHFLTPVLSESAPKTDYSNKQNEII